MVPPVPSTNEHYDHSDDERLRDARKIKNWLQRVDNSLASEEDRYLLGTPLYRPGKPKEVAKAHRLPTDLIMREDDLHANQILLASNLQTLSSIVSDLVKSSEQNPQSLVRTSLDTQPKNHRQPILYNQATSQYLGAPLYPSHLMDRSFERTNEPLQYAVGSHQDSSSFPPFSSQHSLSVPSVGETGHSHSRALYSLRLGNNSILNYHADDRTYPPTLKMMKIPTRMYLEKLQAVWDDTNEHWDERQCTYKIRGIPIPMKYWSADTVNPWDNPIRTQHSRREPVMEELQKYSTIDEFLLAYKDKDGKILTFTKLCQAVRIAQGRKGGRGENKKNLRWKENMSY
ncbi:hypothetical protein EV360DRAFT_90535 [Lentinula raphanica]|nr:hypothetical protein EV360DRAFT_90535 [Lentinula raphanica]